MRQLELSNRAPIASRVARGSGPRREGIIGRTSRHVLLVVMLIPTAILLYFMVVNVFKTNAEYEGHPYGLPAHPTLAPLRAMLSSGEFFHWFLSSAIVTGGSVLISTVIAAVAAYAMVYMGWRPASAFITLLIALMAVPPVLLVIPLYRTVVVVGQLNTYGAAIAIYVGLSLPLSSYLLVIFFRSIPASIIEAARVDVAGAVRTLMSVVLPLSAPALITVVVVQAIWIWNELLIAVIFLQDANKQTLMVGLTKLQGRYLIQVPLLMAGMLLSTLPILILYLVGQGFFVKGLTAGGVKG